jgi:ADP-ribosyl-[dinitrogen reductase] hydrolase
MPDLAVPIWDSNSTAATIGNLLDAQFGERALPANWLTKLELRNEIAQIADDVHAAATTVAVPA